MTQYTLKGIHKKNEGIVSNYFKDWQEVSCEGKAIIYKVETKDEPRKIEYGLRVLSSTPSNSMPETELGRVTLTNEKSFKDLASRLKDKETLEISICS